MTNTKIYTTDESIELLQFLMLKLSHKGRNKVKGLLTHRQIAVDGKIMTRHNYLLHPGQQVEVLGVRGPMKDELLGIRILFEDDDLIVIDKPAGLLSMATEQERERTAYFVLMNYVRHFHPQNRVFIVHRLDRETSGVMMFAKTEAVQQMLQDTWKDTVFERVYIAVVEGVFSEKQGKLVSWLQQSKTKTMYISKVGEGVKAILQYKVLKENKDFSLLEVRLGTGRKNQIRVQMQSVGHSLLGDKRYGAKKNPLGRLALHASVLSFRHPRTDELLRFETPIPPAFRRLFSKE